jgi:hypothetical protein
MELKDWELDQFIATQIMKESGTPPYTANISEAWKVVEKMIHQHHCELKLDVFLGITGQHWIASFYNPTQSRRYEAQGANAPLAICRAARKAFLNKSR